MSLLERIYYFHARIQDGRYPNSGDLVAEFEVSAATAHRDIAYLRDRLLAPLAFDQKKNGYYYTDSGFRLPFADTPRLVALLGVLQKMGEETGLTNLPELRQLQKKIAALVSREVGMPLHLSVQIQAGLPAMDFASMPAVVEETAWDAAEHSEPAVTSSTRGANE